MIEEYQIEGFVCQRCGNCCRGEGFVRITSAEAQNIAFFLNLSLDEFYQNYTVKVHDSSWLRDKPNKDCIFLENNLCRIHPVKPQQCRDFPLKWRPAEIFNYCRGMQMQNEKVLKLR